MISSTKRRRQSQSSNQRRGMKSLPNKGPKPAHQKDVVQNFITGLLRRIPQPQCFSGENSGCKEDSEFESWGVWCCSCCFEKLKSDDVVPLRHSKPLQGYFDDIISIRLVSIGDVWIDKKEAKPESVVEGKCTCYGHGGQSGLWSSWYSRRSSHPPWCSFLILHWGANGTR